MSGGAAATELKPQEPLSGVLLVGWSERPFSGGFSGQAGEIPAWPGVLQERVDDISGGIDDHEDRDLDMAVNRRPGAARNAGNLFMDHGGW